MKKRLMTVFLAICTLLACAGCAKNADSKIQTKSSTSAKKAEITVAGSTACEPLVKQAVKSYAQFNPSVKVNVLGGGSQAGLNQVDQGKVEIGTSDFFAAQQNIVNRDRRRIVVKQAFGRVCRKNSRSDRLPCISLSERQQARTQENQNRQRDADCGTRQGQFVENLGLRTHVYARDVARRSFQVHHLYAWRRRSGRNGSKGRLHQHPRYGSPKRRTRCNG